MGSACAFPLSVAITLPGPAGTHSLWGVGAGCGEVQWFSADIHTASTSHPALRSKRPLPVYCQNNLDCPDRLPNPGPLTPLDLPELGTSSWYPATSAVAGLPSSLQTGL